MISDPLAGPFPTAVMLTDNSDDEGFAISLYPAKPASGPSATARQMSRLLAGQEG